MKDIYDFIKSFDMHTIIIVGIAFWWMNGNIKELDNQISQKIANLSERVNGLSERVAKIEGILTRKEFCTMNDDG